MQEKLQTKRNALLAKTARNFASHQHLGGKPQKVPQEVIPTLRKNCNTYCPQNVPLLKNQCLYILSVQ